MDMSNVDDLDIGNDLRAQFLLASITGTRGVNDQASASREACHTDELDQERVPHSTVSDISEYIVEGLDSESSLTSPDSEEERQVDDIFARLEERRVLLGLRDESMSPMSSGDEAAVQQLVQSLGTVSPCSCY